jgi:predicted ATP-binding protein involved in virulence
MQIRSLSLKNYRCFPQLKPPVEFHEKITVLAAVNGRGKSSILDAIAIALSPYSSSSHFEHGDTKNIYKTDATLKSIPITNDPDTSPTTPESQFPVLLDAEFILDGSKVTSRLELTSSKGRTKPKDAKALASHAEKLADQLKGEIPANSVMLPVVGYYGTGRLHAQKRLTEKKKGVSIHNPRSRTMGYQDCLSPESTYKYFVEWMARTTKAHLQELDPGYKAANPQVYQQRLDGVRNAIQAVLDGQQWTDLRYTAAEDELTVFDGKKRLPLALLSDGLRSIIAMIGDLAYRCIQINPALGAEAPVKTPGIVLIDEIEMHLHPAWQQKILKQLTDAFPNIQFICTTHSPQVLSTIRPESIRTIHEDGRITSPTCKTYGAESKRVLEELMHVDSRPPVLAAELKEFISLTDGGDWSSGRYQQLRDLLLRELGESDPVMINAEIRRNFQQLEAE